MLKQSARCAIEHSQVYEPDAKGYRFVLLKCRGCPDNNFCRKLKNVLEAEVNK